ncbi:heme lyase CcmF/NrfE family subunit [Caldilinea sp.]|jgi:cytochrome c-type biogenesis protein CcmF|uniref:heme lyase CcmF/NrfE family subunit n=1 Tax=Caldilinea sp. TaxID=2293560 RepID=UPI001B25E90E|nr:heme lyase CcmF/NrfE family subunit [Caldilinea sp.]MBO9393523.1 heme lyase CcmF/NrfE family subunit [Caldilinea sp.]
MIFDIGHLILLTAMTLAAFGIVTGYLGGRWRNPRLVQSSFNVVYVVAALVFAATAILWYGLLTDAFQLSYVWNHSERALPLFYKFAALWGGQAGSLLFWCMILSGYSAVVAYANRDRHRVLMPYVNATLLTTSLFFLVLLVFAADPFKRVGFVPPDGQGLNPLLQNFWMILHPVMLYLGYVGMVVPFAFAVAALLSKRLDNEWVRTVRRWTLIPWMFLSAGIIMGSQWAYMELGWGGYWAWDPVENASFLPWLTGTAFLHSIIIQEQRGILKVWNIVLIWMTYFLVILGTFTTRSGIIESVHSFARSDVGPYFLVYLVLILLGFLWLLFDRLPLLRGEHSIDSFTSREAAFLANNWLFAGIAFATLWGTFFPMFSELLTGQRISVAAPFFNKVNGPLFLLLLLLMGVAPLLGWRHTSLSAFRRQFTFPVLAGIAVGLLVFFFAPSLYPIIGLSICAFVTATIVQEYVRGVIARRATTGENVPAALVNLWRRNGRRYGGYIVHLGIVMIGVAVIGNEFYQQSLSVTLARGERAQIGRYELVYEGMMSVRQSNRVEYHALLEAYNLDSGRRVGQIAPQRNIYDKTPDMPTSEVGLHVTPFEDVYVVLNGWESGGASATFTIYINPLTLWMWIGGAVLVLGTLIAAWPHPVQRRSEVARSFAYATGDD